MHRRSLKMKVMAALFSAAFLLGAVDAGAVLERGDIIINKIESIYSAEPQEGFTVGSWSQLGSGANVYRYAVNDSLIAKTLTVNDGGGLVIASKTNTLTIGEANIAGQFAVGYRTALPKDSGVAYGGRNATITGNLTAGSVYVTPADASNWYGGGKDITVKLTVGGAINADDFSISAFNTDLIDISAKNINVTGSIRQSYWNSWDYLADVSAGNLIKAENLNATRINANSVNITSNLNISPLQRTGNGGAYSRYNGENILTIKGNSYLKGGAKLNSKSITGLAAGVITASSTDAINGAQLYGIKKRGWVAGALAGGNMSISSANEISVDKTGSVAAGDSGVLSGGTVYTTTNTVQTALNSVSTSVSKNR